MPAKLRPPSIPGGVTAGLKLIVHSMRKNTRCVVVLQLEDQKLEEAGSRRECERERVSESERVSDRERKGERGRGRERKR
jgi:hypothetical protein